MRSCGTVPSERRVSGRELRIERAESALASSTESRVRERVLIGKDRADLSTSSVAEIKTPNGEADEIASKRRSLRMRLRVDKFGNMSTLTGFG